MYQGTGRAILVSTDPIQRFETVQDGEDEGFAVRISDVYDTQQYAYEPDGYLEGELVSSDYQEFPGTPDLARDTLSAAPLLPAPLDSSEPVLSLTALPFLPAEGGADTLYVDGQLRPTVQRIRSGVPTPVEEETTSRQVLNQRRITYTFTKQDSFFVTAVVDGDTLQTAGTWQVEGDSLRLEHEQETAVAQFDVQLGRDESSARLRTIFQEPLCSTADSECRTFYEYTFGLEVGSIDRGTWEIRNNLEAVPTTDDAANRATRPYGRSQPTKKQACAEKHKRKTALCETPNLFRGDTPTLRPPRDSY